MNIKNICESINKNLDKINPDVYFGIGVAGLIGSCVLSSYITKKRTLSNKNTEAVCLNDKTKMDQCKHKIKQGLTTVKEYSPVIITGGVSTLCLLKSRNKRNSLYLQMASAYSLLDASFTKYRSRVVEKYGEEVDEELMYGLKTKTIRDSKNKTNEKVKVMQEVNVSDYPEYGKYAVYYGKQSSCYYGDFEKDEFTIHTYERLFNDKLIHGPKNHLTLAEVLDEMDITVNKRMMQAAMVVGWTYDKNGNNKNGDNIVKIKIIKCYLDENNVDLTKPDILLDFNVDGVIYDKIK